MLRDEIRFEQSSPLFIPSQDDEDEIKDKPTLRTAYDGFTIYGKTLWLVVSTTAKDQGDQNVLMEDWASSSLANDRE